MKKYIPNCTKIHPHLTPEQRAQIAYLRGTVGLSMNAIAKEMQLTKGCVEWNCLMYGIEHPNPKEQRRSNLTRDYTRNGALIRLWTSDEDRQLLELEQQGKRYFEIARALNRKRNSVQARLATLARREERQAQYA